MTDGDDVWDELVSGELRAAFGEQGWEQLLRVFEAGVTAGMQGLGEASGRGDVEGARRSAHAIKGSAASVGARGVAEQAAAIERGCKEGRLPTEAELSRLSAVVDATGVPRGRG